MINITNREIGIQFEKNIQSILESTKYEVLNETNVRSKYGNHNSCIDHLIITNNYIIAFQDKWTTKKPGISNINHFIQCVNNISQILNKKCLAIYLSKQCITKVSQISFDLQNEKKKNYFICISDENFNILYNKLMKFLYSYEIYYYDDDNYDNCIVMQDE